MVAHLPFERDLPSTPEGLQQRAIKPASWGRQKVWLSDASPPSSFWPKPSARLALCQVHLIAGMTQIVQLLQMDFLLEEDYQEISNTCRDLHNCDGRL